MSGKSASLEPDHAASAGRLSRHEGKLKAVLLAGGILALLTGLCGGMWRLGWTMPHGADLASLHGPLMIAGLFGTLISLERAVALGVAWSYLGPALSAAASFLLIAGVSPAFGAFVYVLAGGVLVAASLKILREQPALFNGILVLGAVAWTIGNLVWFAGGAFADAAGWWLGFLILTIAGERLEMSRLMEARGGNVSLFVAATVLLTAGAGFGFSNDHGPALFGLGLLATTLWLLRHDIARRTIRKPGQVRFFATCMLMGYLWLGVAGLALLSQPVLRGALAYDVAIHAVTIGFVLSMVFGHALIILPAVTGIVLRYTPLLYGPLGLLHLSVLLRSAGGLSNAADLRAASGVLTIAAILGFAACLAAGKLKKSPQRRPAPARPSPANERTSP